VDTTGLIVVAAVLVLGTAVGWWRRRMDGRLRSVTAPAAAVISASALHGRAAGRGPSVHTTAPGVAGVVPGVAGVVPSAAGAAQSVVVAPTAKAGARGVAAGAEKASTGGLATGKDGSDTAVPGGAGTGAAVISRAGTDRAAPEAAGTERGTASGIDPSAAGERIDPELLRSLGVQPAQATLLQFSSAFCAPCRAVRRVSSEVVGLLPRVQHVEVDAESHLDAVRALGIWRTPTLLVLDADGRVVKRATGVPGKPQLIAALGDLLATA
jgi:thiol-disulfide isomerase/thioredoxin